MQEVKQTYVSHNQSSPSNSDSVPPSSDSDSSSEASEDNEGLYEAVASYVTDYLITQTETEYHARDVCKWLKDYGSEMGLSARVSDFVKHWWKPGATCEELYDKCFLSLFKLTLPAVHPIVEDLLKRELLTNANFLGICQKSLQLLPIKEHAQSQLQLTAKVIRLVERHVEGTEDIQDSVIAMEVQNDLMETMDSILNKTVHLEEEMDWVETKKSGLNEQLGLMVYLLSAWELRLFRQL